MTNGPERAEFWKQFLIAHVGYPAPARLLGQLSAAEFSEFCDCGCNSFAVTVTDKVEPLVPPGGGYGAIYEADFKLADERSLEIILFAGETGNLAFVEVDCCANSYPVPDTIDVDEPLRTWASNSLLR